MEKGAKDWLWQCTIPEGTELQEHTLKTKRSIIIGDLIVNGLGGSVRYDKKMR